MNTEVNTGKKVADATPEYITAALVLGALVFLVIIRFGFRGIFSSLTNVVK